MSNKAIQMFENILSEMNWAEQRDEMIADARSSNAHAPDNKKQIKDVSTEEVDDSEEADDSQKKKDDFDDSEIQEDEEDEEDTTFNVKDGLEFKKFKREVNKFRSSRSIKDPEVSEELKKYFERLSSSEKEVLYVLFRGLTQVTLLDMSGSAAYVPSDVNITVKSGSAISKSKKDDIEKTQKKSVQASDDEVMDMKNSPIVIGSDRNDESLKEIYNIVLSNA